MYGFGLTGLWLFLDFSIGAPFLTLDGRGGAPDPNNTLGSEFLFFNNSCFGAS